MFTSLYTYALAALLPTAAPAPGLTSPPGAAPATTAAYRAVDARVRLLPDSAVYSVDGLARCLRTNFHTEAEQARAAFVWVTSHLRYDVASTAASRTTGTSDELAQQALTTRRGVCEHYAALYTALIRRLGLPAYVVSGYTRGAAPATVAGHAWCAIRLEGQWWLLDPTWAAGYVQAGTFVPHPDDSFYRVAPADFIRTHMPFDPLWQLLPAPRTPQQFLHDAPLTPSWPVFQVADSVAAYERQPPLERLRAETRRLQQQGITNAVAAAHLSHNRQLLGRHRTEQYNAAARAYNAATASTNAAIEQLNGFAAFYNQRFRPFRSDAELRQLLAPVGIHLQLARQQLAQVQFQDDTHQALVASLDDTIRQQEVRLRSCEAFVTRYLRTSQRRRPLTFTGLEAAR